MLHSRKRTPECSGTSGRTFCDVEAFVRQTWRERSRIRDECNFISKIDEIIVFCHVVAK